MLTSARIVTAGALTGTVVAIALLGHGSSGQQASAAVLHGLQVAVPAGVGILVLARRPDDRFARALFLSGLAWSVLALTSLPGALPYSAGRVAYWVVEAGLLVLMLAFPSGRLDGRVERAAAAATAAIVVFLYLPAALLVDSYPVPFPGDACDLDCPANAFALTDSLPAAEGIASATRQVVTVLMFAAVAAILVRRTRAAGPLLGRAAVALAGIAVLRTALLVAFLAARSLAPSATVTDVTGWLFLLSLPLVAACFGFALIDRAVHGFAAVPRLVRRLGADATPAQVRGALADVLADPTLAILYRQAGRPIRWVDHTGWPAPPPSPAPGRALTELRSEGSLLGVIVHDATRAHDPPVMDAAAALAVMILKNGDLVGELRESMHDVTESRARVAAVADATRRQIERDLHDGAQQRLVALRLRLAAEGARVRAAGDARTAGALDEVGGEVEQAIDEIRELARGIYPSLLADRGLAAALTAVALAAPVDTTIETDGVGRYPPEIESAVYFACVEAVQNAVKHARGARHIAIALSTDGGLRFEVADDGAGGAHEGGTLAHLRDRLRAVGGEVDVESQADRGTRLLGRVPTT